MVTITPRGHAALAYVAALREAVDQGYLLALNIAAAHVPGERIRATRTHRLLSIPPVDLAVIIELMDGTSWEDAAEALLLPVEEVRARYEGTLAAFREGAGRDDADPEATAAALDQWLSRHADFLEVDPADGPTTRALAAH